MISETIHAGHYCGSAQSPGQVLFLRTQIT